MQQLPVIPTFQNCRRVFRSLGGSVVPYPRQHATRVPHHPSDHNSIPRVTNFPLACPNLLPPLLLLLLCQFTLVHPAAVVVKELLVLGGPGSIPGECEIGATAVAIPHLRGMNLDVHPMLEGPGARIVTLSSYIFNLLLVYVRARA